MLIVGFRDNRAERRATHSKLLATDDYGEREGEGARDDESEGFVREAAGLAKVSVLECGITISKPDVTFVGQ